MVKNWKEVLTYAARRVLRREARGSRSWSATFLTCLEMSLTFFCYTRGNRPATSGKQSNFRKEYAGDVRRGMQCKKDRRAARCEGNLVCVRLPRVPFRE